MKPEELIALTNQYRQERGLPPLKVNDKLMKAAAARAMDMAKTQAFSHTVATTSPAFQGPLGFTEFMRQQKYDLASGGENLATLFNDAPSVVNAWKNSPGHNANLLKDKYTEIGIAVVPGVYQGKQTQYVVQFFGTPNGVKAVPVAPIKQPAKPQNKAQPSPKKGVPLKMPTVDLGKMSQTTPQVIPNKTLPKGLSLG